MIEKYVNEDDERVLSRLFSLLERVEQALLKYVCDVMHIGDT